MDFCCSAKVVHSISAFGDLVETKKYANNLALEARLSEREKKMVEHMDKLLERARKLKESGLEPMTMRDIQQSLTQLRYELDKQEVDPFRVEPIRFPGEDAKKKNGGNSDDVA
jgi:hypothetical protein